VLHEARVLHEAPLLSMGLPLGAVVRDGRIGYSF
jgi:hypothetical protein